MMPFCKRFFSTDFVFGMRTYLNMNFGVAKLCMVALVFLGSANISVAQISDPFASNGASSAFGQSEFLKVTDAFIPSLYWNQDNQPVLDWYIAPDYYLYRTRFVYQTDNQSEVVAEYPVGIEKFDEFFQENLEVFYNPLQVGLEIPQEVENLYIQFQGCAEAGLCYPPEWIGFEIDSTSGAAGYIGQLPAGPPIFSTGLIDPVVVQPASLSTSSNAQLSEDDDGLPSTFMIGVFAGLFTLIGTMIYIRRKARPV